MLRYVVYKIMFKMRYKPVTHCIIKLKIVEDKSHRYFEK